MKLLVDMNRSPTWATRLAQRGYEAVHWAAIGAPTTPDDEILAWAHDQGFVVITNDLDFWRFLQPPLAAHPASCRSECRT